MKKILYGVMSLIMTGAIVTASAFALFSAQATVSGINFNTANAGIEVSTTEDGTYTSDLDVGLDINNVVPGFGEDNDEKATLWVKNTGSVEMDLTAWLSSATGWNDNDLKNVVEVAVTTGADPETDDWKTLVEWNENPQEELPIGPLAPGASEELTVFVRLPEDATGNIEGASLTDITFTIVGTQTTESAE